MDCEILHRLERGTSASEDAGPEEGWIVRSHISWKAERVLARMLAPKGVDCEISHWLEREMSVSEDTEPQRVGGLCDLTSTVEGNECQQGR